MKLASQHTGTIFFPLLQPEVAGPGHRASGERRDGDRCPPLRPRDRSEAGRLEGRLNI